MTPAPQDSRIVVRANGALHDALRERARHSGVNVSEYLRGMIRDKVGLK